MFNAKRTKKTRQLHLWIGLLCSVVILIESVTGLLLNEPWLMGAGSGRPQAAVSGSAAGKVGAEAAPRQSRDGANSAQPSEGRGAIGSGAGGKQQNSLMMWVRGLHEGKIGGTNLKIIVDLTLGLILLTCSGIILSIQTLRAGRAQRKRASSKGEVSQMPVS